MAKRKSKRKNNTRKKSKHRNRADSNLPLGTLSWMDEEGVHAVFPGEPPPKGFFDLLTENFQRELRNSSLWDKMVEQCGEEEAQKLLEQGRAELRP